MKSRVTIRNSLFARISFLFGLLVTVPLVISGLVLSLAGWQTVQSSGREVSRVSEQSLGVATDYIKQLTAQKLKSAADRISDAGGSQVDIAARLGVEVGSRKLRESTDRMRRSADSAILSASGRLVQVSKGTLDRAVSDLGTRSRESQDALHRQFVSLMEEQLPGSSAPVIAQLENELVDSWRVSSEQRALAVRDWCLSQISQSQERMALRMSLSAVATYSPDEPTPFATQYLGSIIKDTNNSGLRALRIVLVAEDGTEYLRLPEKDLPDGQEPPDWEKHPTRTGLLSGREPFRVEPMRFDELSQHWRIRIAHKIVTIGATDPTPLPRVPEAGAPPALPSIRFGVLDLAVDDLVDSAVLDPGKTRLAVIEVTADGKPGRVISSTRSGIKGALAARIQQELSKANPIEHEKSRLEFSCVADDARLLCVARYWPDAGCWLVATQAEEEVRAGAVSLAKSLLQASTVALDIVRQRGEELIRKRRASTADASRRLVRAARAEMQKVVRQQTAIASRSLASEEEKLRSAIPLEIRQEMERSRAPIRRAIASVAEQTAKSATEQAQVATDTQKQATAREIMERSNEIADAAAGKMMLNSTWLIPLFLLLALLLATLTARSIVRPINRLEVGTQALAEGEYDRRIETRGEDELARLALAFNHMAEAIQQGQSELQESHDILSAEKLRIQAIVDSSPDGLMMIEPGEQIALINPAAMRLLYLQQARLPTPPFEISSLPPEIAEPLQSCRKGNDRDGVAEFEITQPKRRVLQVREVRLRSPGGRAVGSLVHLHDVTRERVIDEMKSDFISLVSHELRTPLTSILGFSSYMLSGKLGSVDETQTLALESIHRQAKRLSAIISDFLDISRIESGKIQMKMVAVPLRPLAERVIEDLRPQAAEKSIHVSVIEGAEGEAGRSLIALADEQRISQVFTNLIGNALKFTDREGVIEVMLKAAGREIHCHVRDSGCGIPPDELDRVFDRFYQVEKVVTRKSGGTGLGLAIVKNIIESHGGRIWLESQVGQGTTVHFILPAADPIHPGRIGELASV